MNLPNSLLTVCLAAAIALPCFGQNPVLDAFRQGQRDAQVRANAAAERELLRAQTELLRTQTEASKPTDSVVDSGKFSAVHRAAKTIEAATLTGVNYAKFGELLQSFAAEVAIVRDSQLTPKDRDILVSFSAALSAYLDSASLWKKKIERSDDIYQGQIAYGVGTSLDPDLEPIVKRYGLDVSRLRVAGVRDDVLAVPASSVQFIWGFAGQATARAVALYMPRSEANAVDADASRLLDELTKGTRREPLPYNGSAATIWLYRTKSSTDSMLNPTLYWREGRLAKLEKGQFFAVSVQPGVYYFSWTDKPKQQEEARIAIKGGETVFLKVRYREIKLMSSSDAKKDFEKLVPIQSENVLMPGILTKSPF